MIRSKNGKQRNANSTFVRVNLIQAIQRFMVENAKRHAISEPSVETNVRNYAISLAVYSISRPVGHVESAMVDYGKPEGWCE